jgi:hypothetical protein
MGYINITDTDIKVYGVSLYADGYRRLPAEVGDNANDGVKGLSRHTAGGCLRFRTAADSFAVKVKLIGGGFMVHMPLSGMSGIDAYVDGEFVGICVPPDANTLEYERMYRLTPGLKNVQINLPLYNGVEKVEIDCADIQSPLPYKTEKPLVFYGSSITQGGCASRPGNCYTSLISRRLDAAQINLGFSGSARGEEIIADYIANLEMSVFVLDYDHNAPSAEHLAATHRKFFNIIRAKQPDLPIIAVSKPDFDPDKNGNAKRRDIVLDTVKTAYESGDRNVYFIDGETLFGSADRTSCTVDTCHPNDIGFHRMAEVIGARIASLL